MDYKPWQMFLGLPPNLEPSERGFRMVKAGVGYISCHDTEAEAKAAAEEVLRKLKQVDDTEWVVFYVEPYMDRVGPGQRNINPVPRRISTSDLAD